MFMGLLNVLYSPVGFRIKSVLWIFLFWGGGCLANSLDFGFALQGLRVRVSAGGSRGSRFRGAEEDGGQGRGGWLFPPHHTTPSPPEVGLKVGWD